MEAKTKIPAPPGTKPMMISMKNMEKYGLKTGSSLTDVLLFKMFNKTEVEEEIAKIGFYSDFHGFRTEIASYPLDEILVVADSDEVYGENWLICLTPDAMNSQKELLRSKIEAAEAERLEREAEAKRKEDAEKALETIVYEDKPIVPRERNSVTASATFEEVDALTLHIKRSLLSFSISRRRREFGQFCKFSDRDADVSGVTECRQHKDPNYDLNRSELDVGIQAVEESAEAGSQTTWYRPVNNSVQYEPVNLSASELLAQFESPALLSFLADARNKVEQSLQQNETIDIFRDEFGSLGDEEAGLNKTGESSFKELRTFTNLVFSKNKLLTAIDWHPARKGLVAVSAALNLTFEQRVLISGKVDTSYVLLWSFADLINPQLKLSSPHDVTAFRFNPTQPNIIAAGTQSGQVLMWDTADAEGRLRSMRSKKHRSAAAASAAADGGPDAGGPGAAAAAAADGGGDAAGAGAAAATAAMPGDGGGGGGGAGPVGGGGEGGDKTLPPVGPASVSYIDTSHRRPVADLFWLPPTLEVTSKGVVKEVPGGLKSYQFLTIATDGQILVWDIRYKEIFRRNPRLNANVKLGKDGQLPDPVWNPQFRLTLVKLEGIGELGICRIALGLSLPAGPPETLSQFYASTEEGDMIFGDWLAKKAAADDDDDEPAPAAASGAAGGAGDFVKWIAPDHFRSTVALIRSPFFPDVLLSVGDWGFHLWKEDSPVNEEGKRTPLFVCPPANTYVTVGRWSPTRPAVVMLGKIDGTIDVWDLTDQSHRPSATLSVAPSAICSMEFWKAPPSAAAAAAAALPVISGSAPAPPAGGGGGGGGAKQQLLAVGDVGGNLHILDTPRNLFRPVLNEEAQMAAFLEREQRRDIYCRLRAVVRAKEKERGEAAAQAQETVVITEEAARAKQEQEDAHAEKVYRDLEARFREELGLDPPAQDTAPSKGK